MNKQEFISILENPSEKTRGRTRWWWYGCAVKKEEITRELDFMKESGIGGVELQVLYPLEADDPEKGIKNHDYLSPEYFELIRFASEEANKRGMQFDMTLGSSWPYGGPFIPEELAGQNVLPFVIDLMGPCKFSQDLTTILYGKVVGAVLGKMEGDQMLPETMVDVTEKITEKLLFNWPWGTEIQELDIPEGLHKLVIFISAEKKQRVLKPLNGGDGFIVDHNSRKSLRCFLKYAGDPVDKEIPGITDYFCDSIEVFGNNWTDELYLEFFKRRGYDLHPYLYALWGEVQGLTDKVRYDYHKTLGELTIEEFFRELNNWCHEKGKRSRIQAHGTWGDILQAYGAADIPEGETFSAFDRYEVNTVHRRLAASAGHIYGKNIISNESFTWLRFPRFTVTLEHMKAAVDSIFLDGINQIYNHGYSYSEKSDHEMTPFYASSNINHTNTWWRHYHVLGRYINRVCEMLQRGKNVATTAIYLPQHDIWAEHPIADTHMTMKLDERFGVPAIDAINKAGYWFDYINDDGVEKLTELGYDTVILMDCERIPLETMKLLKNFAEKGGKLIAAGNLPRKSCGLRNYEENTSEINSICEELIISGKVTVTRDKFASLIKALKNAKDPDAAIMSRPDITGFVHRKDGDDDIFFVSGISPEAHEEEILFTGMGGNFTVCDPMTGKEVPVKAVEETAKGVKVSLSMEPFLSLIFVFGKNMGRPLVSEKPETEVFMDISKGWLLSVPELNFSKRYDRLIPWNEEKELRYFSGTGVYKKRFLVKEIPERVILELENLGETATITVNGKTAGELIMLPHSLDISGLLKTGMNTIEIAADNLLINRMIDPDYPESTPEEPVLKHWPYETGKLRACRGERVFNYRERDMIKEPLSSGIWGKVLLKK